MPSNTGIRWGRCLTSHLASPCRSAFRWPHAGSALTSRGSPVARLGGFWDRLLCPTDPNRVTVDDDECPREFRIGHFCEESLERVLGFFDGGRPDSEPDDPCVGTHGKGPLIGEVFVEGHNDGVSVLRPGKDFCIGTSRQGDV